jgi:hypothetical protein
MVAFALIRRALHGTSAGQKVNNEDDQRDDEQKVNQTAADVRDQTQKPENQKNNKNRPKHPLTLPFL